VRSSYSKIRRAAAIGDVRRRGKRYGEGRVVVYVLPSGDGTKVGFVSSRTVGGAVARNRARRLMREAWRGLAPRVRSNYDVVAVARSEIRGAKMQDVMADLERALHAAGLIEP
jgi:ribonuclease P protein component